MHQFKQFTYLIFLSFFFNSCQLFEAEMAGEGTVSLKSVAIDVLENNGRVEISTDDLTVVIKDDDDTELFKWEGVQTIPDTLIMQGGDYVIFAYSDTLSLPNFTSNFYSGDQSFSITPDEHTEVELLVSPAGAKIELSYAENIPEDFINYYAKVIDSGGTEIELDSATFGPLYVNPGQTEVTIYLVFLDLGNDTTTQEVVNTYDLVSGQFLQLAIEATLNQNRAIFEISVAEYEEVAETISINIGFGLEDGLIAYYPFNGNADDESSNSNNGLVFGATSITDRNGIPNSAYEFDGVDDYINLGGSEILSLGRYDAFTVAMWVNPYVELSGTGKGIFGKYNSSSERIYSFSYHETRDFAMRFFENGDSEPQFRLDTEVETTTWQNLICTYDRDEVKIYLNGALVASGNVGFNIDDGSAETNVVIGAVDRITTPFDGNFNGGIDDIRIYDRKLSDMEIVELSNF